MSFRPIAGDTWILARPKYKKRGPDDAGIYGAYPAGFLWRARALLGIHLHDPLLHICGGRVKDYIGDSDGLGPNDRTIDLDPTMEPDFLMDVRELGLAPGKKFPLLSREPTSVTCVVANVEKKTRAADSPLLIDGRDFSPSMLWPAALIDRPYTPDDAEHYLQGKGREVFPEKLTELLAAALSLVRPGGIVGILDYLVPSPPSDAKFMSLSPVWTGYNNRMRAYSTFRGPLVLKRMKGKPLNVEIRTDDEAPDAPEEVDDPLDVVVAQPPAPVSLDAAVCAAGPPVCVQCLAPAHTLLAAKHWCKTHVPSCKHCGKPGVRDIPSGGIACKTCGDYGVRTEPPQTPAAIEDAALRSAAFDI